MINLEQYLYDKVMSTMDTWDESDIYAISFFIHANTEYTCKGFSNVSIFSISYNTERDCNYASKWSEERWNYAFWRQDEISIIDTENEAADILFKWYEENSIIDIGFEDENLMYDNNGEYIGKGPVGFYELLCVVSGVARRLQTENYLVKKFGRMIPIIVHDLEYPWFVEEATRKANPNGEANIFLEALKKGFPD